ncbi:MAG: hypothetical protein QXZ70_01270 [Candidatus Bathyarchaeia archaeon]
MANKGGIMPMVSHVSLISMYANWCDIRSTSIYSPFDLTVVTVFVVGDYELFVLQFFGYLLL